jgi:hypothetical protein
LATWGGSWRHRWRSLKETVNTWKGRNPVALRRGYRHPLDLAAWLRHEHGGIKVGVQGAARRVPNCFLWKFLEDLFWTLAIGASLGILIESTGTADANLRNGLLKGMARWVESVIVNAQGRKRFKGILFQNDEKLYKNEIGSQNRKCSILLEITFWFTLITSCFEILSVYKKIRCFTFFQFWATKKAGARRSFLSAISFLKSPTSIQVSLPTRFRLAFWDEIAEMELVIFVKLAWEYNSAIEVKQTGYMTGLKR